MLNVRTEVLPLQHKLEIYIRKSFIFVRSIANCQVRFTRAQVSRSISVNARKISYIKSKITKLNREVFS